MRILLDTHVLVWAVGQPRRLTRRALDAIVAPESELCVSAVIAWEFADLRRRGKFGAVASFDVVADALALSLLDTPASIWRQADDLPHHHGDPVDRMLVAHAIHADLTLVTADATIRRYPVRTLW